MRIQCRKEDVILRVFQCFISMLLLFAMIVPNHVQAEGDTTLHKEKIYNLLVDRYNNGNQENSDQVDVNDLTAYHGGDFKGIEAKLDTIKEAGFTTISISAIAENREGGHHGYWIDDFQAVEPQFGTLKEFNELVEKAHDKDLKIVLEFVTGYASATNKLFADDENQEWIETTDVDLDMPWNEDIVKMDLTNPDVQTYFMETAQFWKETGVDGFVLHAADQLPIEFVEQFSKELKAEDTDFWLLAQTLEAGEAIEALQDISTIDIVADPALKADMVDVFSTLTEPLDALYRENPQLLFVDDAYSKRFAQAVGEEGRNATTVWKLALTYMYTADGVPFIYQGSEYPMFAPGYPESQMLVQFNSGDPELEEFVERIASLREEFPTLTEGEFELVGSAGAMTVFKRSDDKKTFYIAINNDDRSQGFELTDLPKDKQLNGFLGDNLVREDKDDKYVLTLARESSEIYMVEEDAGINWLFIAFIITVMVVFIVGVIILFRQQKKRETEEKVE